MQIGCLVLNATGSAFPAAAALELEERGIESMWVPEHSHLPLEHVAYPGGGDVPPITGMLREPLVSLAAAAAVTSEIVLGTGVCLALQHDLLGLASSVATLAEAASSAGARPRVVLGVAAGWNAAELADHRPDVAFGQRYAALGERIAALRAAWQQPEHGFDGRWDRFAPCRRAPLIAPHQLPVAVGATGPVGMQLAAEVADVWCPVDVALTGATGQIDVAGGIERFREMVAGAGRDDGGPSITLFVWGRPTAARLDSYEALGVERVVLRSPTNEPAGLDDLRRQLDAWGDVLAGRQR
ncbi:MAG: LLM class flavin-dependent oxidoreductase [Actinobacteria bacterium]|nr:LLM class flavin-dependent oxidoreductase [Actinomycetota bacterium]